MGYTRTLSVNLEQEKSWLVTINISCKIHHDGVRLTFTTFIYWLWHSQNDKIYNGKVQSVSSLFELIKGKVRIKL